MNFEEFWKNNKERYLKIAELDIKLAINCACKDAWNLAYSEGRNKTESINYESNFNVCYCGDDNEKECTCHRQKGITGGWCDVHGSELIY